VETHNKRDVSRSLTSNSGKYNKGSAERMTSEDEDIFLKSPSLDTAAEINETPTCLIKAGTSIAEASHK